MYKIRLCVTLSSCGLECALSISCKLELSSEVFVTPLLSSSPWLNNNIFLVLYLYCNTLDQGCNSPLASICHKNKLALMCYLLLVVMSHIPSPPSLLVCK